MDSDFDYFQQEKERARSMYAVQQSIHCPYFSEPVVLNADGFHHLQFSARRERSKPEQLSKFRLLRAAFEVIRKSGTVQEYRKLLCPVGKRSAVDGGIAMKEVEYWAFIAIIGDAQRKVRVIVRKVGNGNKTFWSVMFHSKRKDGKQKLYTGDIEDET